MIDALTDPLASGIGTRALIELVLLGAVCGPLGVWAVLYRQSYAAESISHSMLPGLVLASLAGIPLGLGAAAGLAGAALAIAAVSRRAEVSEDAAVAVVVTTLFGAGALLALSPEVPVRLGELLFGNPLSVSLDRHRRLRRPRAGRGARPLLRLSAARPLRLRPAERPEPRRLGEARFQPPSLR